MKLPENRMTPTASFLDQLDAAKTKAQVIDILCMRASQQGWFSGIAEHPGLYDKITHMRSVSRPKEPEAPPVEPTFCEACET